MSAGANTARADTMQITFLGAADTVTRSRHAPALPLYTVADAKRALARIVPLAPGRSTRVGNVGVSLSQVGPLLGACAVTLQAVAPRSSSRATSGAVATS